MASRCVRAAAAIAGAVAFSAPASAGPAADMALIFRDHCLAPDQEIDARADGDSRLTRLSEDEAHRLLPGQDARIWRAVSGAATAYLILRGGEVPTNGGSISTSLCTLALRGVEPATATAEIASTLALGDPDETRPRETGGDTFLHSVVTEAGRFEVLIATNPNPNASVPVMLSAVPR